MIHSRTIVLIIFTCFLFHGEMDLFAQSWEFVKERDGIRIYTREEMNSPVKAYKGEVFLRSSVEKVKDLLTDAENFDWWDESISDMKVLGYQKDNYLNYYLVYNVPWPATDRDLCAESLISYEPASGAWIISSKSSSEGMPEQPGLVRIKNYWQRWIVEPAKADSVHLVLEGFADPAGSVPSWIINMAITDTPLNVIEKVRERVEE